MPVLNPEEWTAVALSLKVAVWATVLSLPVGIAVAYVLARKAFWGKALLDSLVLLPLAMPGIIAGAVLAFARALGEFGATITFVSNIPGETQTISAAIYTFLQVPGGDPAALRLAAVAVVISLIALALSEWLARRAAARLHGI